MTPNTKSFPFHELEVLARSDVRRSNAAIDAIEARLKSQALREELTQVIGQTYERQGVELDTVRCAFFREVKALDLNAWFGLLKSHAGSGPALLMIDPGLIQSWLGDAFDDQARRVGAELDPEDWGAIAFGVLQVLKTLVDRGMQPLMLASTPPHREALERYFQRNALHEFSWVLTDHATAGWVRLLVPVAMVNSMISRSSSLDAIALANAIQRPMLGQTRLRFSASLGRRRVPRQEFSLLERGDIVIPDSHCLRLDDVELRQPYRPGRLSREKFCVLGHLDAREATWRFILDPTPEALQPDHEDPMSEPTDTSNAPSERETSADEKTQTFNISALNAAHVEVEVRVGCIEMSVAELARIQPGKVLELDRKVGELVDLVVDGHVHATGELVNVEGVVGVRVTSLNTR